MPSDADLWPPLHRLPDETPCWCADPDAQIGHTPVCTARRSDRVLVIDDEREFRFPATYARNLLDAEALLFRPDGWDEVWWDHDLGTAVTRPLAARLERMAIYLSDVPRCDRPVVHSSNPEGSRWLRAALLHAYGRCEVVAAADYLR